MYTRFLLLFVLPILAFSYPTWFQFCVEYHKDCDDQIRQEIYEARIQSWAEITEYTLVVTERADWTQEQLSQYYSSLRQGEDHTNSEVGDSFTPPKIGNPSEFDWRNQGIITSVKNQGSCGSCWSFAAAAHVESKLVREKFFNNTIDLSQQYLLECTYQSTCSGGYMQYTMPEALKMPTEEQYPYKEGPYYYRQQICSSATIQTGVVYKNFYNLYDSQIIGLLLEKGPLPITIRSDDNWNFYSGGIYSCGFEYNGRVNHAVLLVGYTPNSWIIKNQWGKNWGNSGFMEITRQVRMGKNCLIGTGVFYIDGQSKIIRNANQSITILGQLLLVTVMLILY